METTPPFDLNELKRDWIAGQCGRSFYECVQRRISEIELKSPSINARGVLLLERDPIAFAASFFAASFLRVPIILANPRWQRREWDEVREWVDPALVFGPAPFAQGQGPRVEAQPPPSSILIPTGGSTGGVKFAIHRWETLAAACAGVHDFLGPGPMHACCVLPLYHVSGLMQLIRAFLSGGQIAFPDFKELQAGAFPGFEPGSLCVSLVPTQLQRLCAHPGAVDALRQAKAIFVGGAPMSPSLAARARSLRLPIVLSYGMTETAAMVAALPAVEFLADQASGARLLSHVAVDLVSDEGRACLPGESGRIRIQTRALFQGYYGRSPIDLSAGYVTEDAGSFDSMGRLHLHGRCDRLILSGGEKIDPQEVEAALLRTGAAEQVLAIGWPDPEWGQVLVAFYVASGALPGNPDWEQSLRADLTHYKIPKLMIPVPDLPLDERGKADRGLMASWIAHARE